MVIRQCGSCSLDALSGLSLWGLLRCFLFLCCHEIVFVYLVRSDNADLLHFAVVKSKIYIISYVSIIVQTDDDYNDYVRKTVENFFLKRKKLSFKKFLLFQGWRTEADESNNDRTHECDQKNIVHLQPRFLYNDIGGGKPDDGQ